MTVCPVANVKLMRGRHELTVTSRWIEGMPLEQRTNLIVRTVNLWCYIAKLIDEGTREAGLTKEGEPLAAVEDMDTFDETRVTVFNWSYTLPKKISLTVHSDTTPQQALDIFWAEYDALEILGVSESAPNATKTANTGDSSPSTAPQATTSPTAPQNAPNPPAPTDGVIRATLGPTKTRPQYADGQLVEFVINRIEATSDKGISIIKLWSPVSSQWAVSNVFKTKPNSAEPSPSWLAIKDTIDSIGLTMDQPSVDGSWVLLTKAAHKDGKEFMNPQSLKAI